MAATGPPNKPKCLMARCHRCRAAVATPQQAPGSCPGGSRAMDNKSAIASTASPPEPDSLAGAVAPRAEARAWVGFGPGGLAVRWRSFVRVAGWRRTPPARRPRLAREGGPRARHRGQRACSLESSCPSLSVRSCRMRLGLHWGQVGVLTARSAPRQAGGGPTGGTDSDGALTDSGAMGN